MTENEMSKRVIGLGNYKLDLLMNFNVVRLKDGIKRVVNGLSSPQKLLFCFIHGLHQNSCRWQVIGIIVSDKSNEHLTNVTP
jgi:hypothetical protein